jgi:hypothetical protein
MRAAALALGAASVVTACGGTTSLPDPPPCATPTATPTLGPARGIRQVDATAFAYYRVVNDGSTKLHSLTRDFRDRWPDGKFYHQPEFRTDFVAFAGQSACLTGSLQALAGAPEASRLAGLKALIDPIFVNYETALNAGREAVRTRNVTDYRAFNRRIDELAAQVDDALASYRGGPQP